MEDKLKNFIHDHKDSFESDVPSDRVWEGIEKEFSKKNTSSRSNNFTTILLSIAAMFIIGLLLFKGDDNVINQGIAEVETIKEEIGISNFSEEMGEVENFYIQEVNDKINLLDNYEVDAELLSEIDFLKEEYEELKTEMTQSVNPLGIIERMIDNYRLRLEILEDILEEFEEDNTRDKSNNTKENEMA